MITGSIVALVTPMHEDGSVDWGSLERLVEIHVEAGTAAIGAVGTTGESATLSVPEHCDVIRFCVKQAECAYIARTIPGRPPLSMTSAGRQPNCAKMGP